MHAVVRTKVAVLPTVDALKSGGSSRNFKAISTKSFVEY